MVALTATFSSSEVNNGKAPTRPDAVAFEVDAIARMLWIAATVVISFGILREFALAAIGSGTALKDLRHFAFDAEHSLPAWFSTLAMASAAGVLTLIATISRRDDPKNRMHWSLLALLFLALSIDEAIAVHEITMAPLRKAFKLSGALHFSWVIVAAPLLLAAGAYFLPFLLRLPRRTGLRFAIAGGLFVTGAFGLELVGGYLVSASGFESVPYKVSASLEEGLEIVGLTLFVTSLIRYLAERRPLLQVALDQ